MLAIYRFLQGSSVNARRLATVSLLLIVWFLGGKCASATNTTYYINNTGSPACSDSNAGTSTSAPWCGFTNVNGHTFSQGDQILLYYAGFWSTGMTPLGSGVSGNPITIGCYPASNCLTSYPSLNMSSSSTDIIYLENPSYWTISHLVMQDGNSGIHANFTQLGNQGLTFSNLWIHGLSGTAIVFDGYNTGTPVPGHSGYYTPAAIPSGQYIINGVNINNVVSYENNAGIQFLADYAYGSGQLGGNYNAQQNIVVTNYRSEGDTDPSLVAANMENSIFIDISIDNNANYGSEGGSNAYLTGSENIIFNNGLYTNAQLGSIYDNSIFVWDNTMSTVKWRGNFFYNNVSSGLEGAENPNFGGPSTNSGFDIADNGFSENSTYDSSIYWGDISARYSPETTGTIENNVYYDTPQTYNGFTQDVSSTYWTLTNNTASSASTDVYRRC